MAINKSFTLQNITLGTRTQYPPVSVAQGTTDYDAGVVSVPTTAGGTNIPLGLTAPREAVFRNLDATNFVTVGVVQGGTYRPFLHLGPGQWSAATLGMGPTELFARADTAAVDLQYEVHDA